MANMLKVKTKNESGAVTVFPEGRIDANTARLFDKETSAVVDEAVSMTMDFEKVEYIASAGIRVILGACKEMLKKGGDYRVINVSENIMEIFEMTGLRKKMNISGK